MIQGIQNTSGINSYFSSGKKAGSVSCEPLNSFETEDTAIISAQAKLSCELDKYNSGESSELDLAIAGITSRNQVRAAARAIKTKKEMFDAVLDSF